MKNEINIAIIGFGEVGTIVASSINTKYNNINFNIIDTDENISGRILDFSHACACKNNEVFINDFEDLQVADFVIYAAGHCNSPGESRNSVAKENKNLVESIFLNLKLKLTAVILVVTNPVELVSRWIYESLGKSNLVLGTGTSLDTFRLNYIISQEENCLLNEVNSLVVGEHGQHMLPLFSKSYLGKQKLSSIYSEKKQFELLDKLKMSATEIRKTEKATKYGVAECVLLIISSLISDKKVSLPLSVLVSENQKKQFGLEESIFMSLPCTIENDEVKVNELENLSEFEFQAIKTVARHLEKLYFSV
jgi:L-lactate dehydrogenase